MTTRPDTREQEAIVAEDGAGLRGGSELERVMLQEVRRVGRAVESLSERMDEKFTELRRDARVEAEKLEGRVRTLELQVAQADITALKAMQAQHGASISTLTTSQAVTGSKLAMIIGAAGVVATILTEGLQIWRGH
jgi:hypothetical protein